MNQEELATVRKNMTCKQFLFIRDNYMTGTNWRSIEDTTFQAAWFVIFENMTQYQAEKRVFKKPRDKTYNVVRKMYQHLKTARELVALEQTENNR